MKKYCVLLTLCLLLYACGGNTAAETTVSSTLLEMESEFFTSMPGLDAQNQYLLFSSMGLQENEDYFIGSGMLGEHFYYYDKVSGISGLLCADPACAHDTADCGAYSGNGGGIFLYDGQRYWIADDYATDGRDLYLRCSDLAGTNQIKLKKICFEEIILPYQPQQYAIHRGKLFFRGESDAVTGTAANRRITLAFSPLDGSEEFTILFDETYDAYANSEMRFAGDYVYLATRCSYDNGARFCSRIFKIHIDSGETETIFEEMDSSLYVSSLWVTKEETIYFACRDTLYKVEDGIPVEIAVFSNKDAYILTVDGIALNTYTKDGLHYIEIKDFFGNTVYDGAMFPGGIPELEHDIRVVGNYSWAVLGGDGEKLILAVEDEAGRKTSGAFKIEDRKGYVILLDIQNDMEAAILWTETD